jgi:two-component system chemotaxis sensor kinase CheA
MGPTNSHVDVAEYLPLFLAEAGEHLQELNLAVVRIEADPTDAETVNEIFRIAHSLKGMSATMGFAGIAALTHTMEDVFELLRQRSGGLSPDAVDVVFECLDALSAAVASIEREGSEHIDPAPLVARLERLVRRRGDHQPAPPKPSGPPAAVVEALQSGARVVRVSAALATDVAMPSVRAYMALTALAEHGEILVATPSEDELEGFTSAVVEAWLRSDATQDVLRTAVEAVPEVDEATFFELGSGVSAAPKPRRRHATPARKRRAPMVHVDSERLAELGRLVHELREHEQRVGQLAAEAALPELARAVDELRVISEAVQAAANELRLAPVEDVFLRLPRMVRDLSKRLGKEVDLRLAGQDTQLERTVVDALGDPLVHLVRNALSHGCETPADRDAAGKPRTATLEITATPDGDTVLVEVRDDGNGIDPATVGSLAVQRGLIEPAELATLDMEGAVDLLFSPGFSTAAQTSDISGRGVGLDAVRDRLRALGGEVSLLSTPGEGTVARLRLPAPSELNQGVPAPVAR